MKGSITKADIQLCPAKIRVMPNIKLIKNITEFDAEDYQELLSGEEGGVIEKRKHKKLGDVITCYKIGNADGYDGESPLIELDAAVLRAIVSEQKIGNEHTTAAIILRVITGKTRKTRNGTVNKNQREAILHSVTKLMQTIIDVDLSDTNKALGYNDGKQ